MFSTSLVFTTLVAALCAVSVNAGDLSAKNTVNPIQCSPVKLEWTGGESPYNVYVFTDCQDNSDAPIATFSNVTGNSVSWNPTLVSGKGFFFQVEDATGADDFSDDDYMGGDASNIDDCKKEIASQKAAAAAATATPDSNSASASGGVPTTMSHSTTTSLGASGVANAASDPTSGVGNKAGSDAVTNGASSLIARPFEIAAGVLAAGVVAFL